MDGLPDNVAGFSATGQVTGDDYESVIVPTIDSKLQTHEKLRLLYHLGPEFKRFTTTALWDDAKVGMHHLTAFERVAIVSDVGWINTMAKGIGLAMPTKLRTFANDDLEAAKRWIAE